MNGFFLGASLLIVSASPETGLTTDRLDAYADQVEINRMSCGPTALWYCFRQFGLDVDRWRLCGETGVGSEGTSLESLLRASAAHGLDAHGITSPTKDLHSLPVPSIIVVGRNHCVVYEGIDRDGDDEIVSLFDPATARILTAPREMVAKNWTGEAIVFERPHCSTTAFWIIAGCMALATNILTTGILRKINVHSRQGPATGLSEVGDHAGQR